MLLDVNQYIYEIHEVAVDASLQVVGPVTVRRQLYLDGLSAKFEGLTFQRTGDSDKITDMIMTESRPNPDSTTTDRTFYFRWNRWGRATNGR